MTKIKKVLSYVLILSILCTTLVCSNAVDADAAAANGIKGNGTGGISIDINASPYTDFANIAQWGQYAYGSAGCAWFASARVKQLTGKGNMIYQGTSWYNTAYASLGFSRGNEMKAPAIVCWSGHVAILEKISGATAYISEGGSTYYSDASHGYSVIRTVNTASLTSLNSGFLGYVYLPGSGDIGGGGNNPRGCLDSVWGGAGMVHVSGWAFDEDDLEKQLDIDVYIGGTYATAGAEVHKIIANTERWDVHEAYPGYGMYHGFDGTIQTQKTGEQPVYVYAINYGGGNENPLIGQGTVTISALDSKKPVITDTKIYDVGPDGYTVSCKVTDDFEVDRVQFPTWTLAGGQDDLLGDWQTNSLVRGIQNGDTYTFYVKRSEHNDEYGLYQTHIYAWDKAGNSTLVELENVLVEKDDEKPKIEKAEITEITDNHLIVHVEVSDNKKIRDIMWYCLNSFQPMGTAAPLVGDLSSSLDEIIYPGEKTYMGDITIDLSGWERISDYHVLYILVTDISGNIESFPIPFYLAAKKLNEIKLQLGEQIDTDKLYERIGITNPGSWKCLFGSDESILKKQESGSERTVFTSVKTGVEYIYFLQVMSRESRSCKITVVEKTGEEVPQPPTFTAMPDNSMPKESSIPSLETNTPNPPSQDAVPTTTPDTTTVSPEISVPKVQGLSVKNPKGHGIKCSWKKTKGAELYSIQIAQNRSFTKGKKGTKIYGTKYIRYSLKKNKTYYVRVRAWKYVTGFGYVSGKWSAVRKIKIRK